MINDVIAESGRLLARCGARSIEDIRGASAPVVAFSPAMAAEDRAIKAFLLPRMYRHPRIVGIMDDAERVVVDLFGRYMACVHDLPRGDAAPAGGQRARHVADFIAGMTDRYALSEHARLFDSTPKLR